MRKAMRKAMRQPARASVALAALTVVAALVAGCSSSDGSSGGSADGTQRTSAPTSTSAAASTSPTSRAAEQAAPAPASTTRATAKPKARPTPVNHCARNTSAQKVLVSLAKQHMWLCAKQRTVYDNAITSGMVGQYTATPTGNYVIEGRNRDTVLTLNTGATYPVRYWIPFDAPLFGFHDSSWQTFPYGSPKYKTDGSHGCVHMPLKAIAFLYRWAGTGPTDVRIS